MGDTADSGSTEPTHIGAGRGVGKPYKKNESLEKVRAVLDGKLCANCVGSGKRRQRIMARIPVIEDETDIRGLCRRLLEQAGHEVIEAPDGDPGVKFHRKNPTDLIITDIIYAGKGRHRDHHGNPAGLSPREDRRDFRRRDCDGRCHMPCMRRVPTWPHPGPQGGRGTSIERNELLEANSEHRIG
jgi:hypothetical protein